MAGGEIWKKHVVDAQVGGVGAFSIHRSRLIYQVVTGEAPLARSQSGPLKRKKERGKQTPVAVEVGPEVLSLRYSSGQFFLAILCGNLINPAPALLRNQ